MNCLQVNPDKELEFNRPFTSVVKQTLDISNTSSDAYIAFKIKTTSPKQYCVRPNSGKLAPGESTQVQVLLQAMKEEPPQDFKCKDKFLVQAIKVPKETMDLEGEALTVRVADLWSKVDAIKKEDANTALEIMQEHKLKVVFGPNAPEKSPSLQESVVQSFKAPAVEEQSPIVNESNAEKELRDAKETIKKLSMACDGYRSEIDRLNLLRQRKSIATEGSSIPSVSQQYPQPGLPIQMVALVGLIAFLIGSILF